MDDIEKAMDRTRGAYLKTSVTVEDIDAIFATAEFHDAKLGNKTTAVTIIMDNGFEITETSSCVDPDNYKHELGVQICKKNLKNKVWAFMGFNLQQKLYEKAKEQ